MGSLKVRADRTAVGLPTLPVVELSDFNKQIALPFQQSLDDQAYTTVSTVNFTPSGTTIPPGNIPPGTPPPGPSGAVLYDSTVNSKLHDGKKRTIEKEGSTSAGGKGLEVAASGSPKIVVNTDKTFSLVCKAGHGRFYCFVKNFNATLDIECAFWNSVSGQDCSLKLRSRHQEGGSCDNRFGGYGMAVDRKGWGAKREVCHNTHDQSHDGKLPFAIATQKYFNIQFTVKNESGGVRQIGKMNGTQFASFLDTKPAGYMVHKEDFDDNSYFWVRSNIDSGTGELRIKRLRIFQA